MYGCGLRRDGRGSALVDFYRRITNWFLVYYLAINMGDGPVSNFHGIPRTRLNQLRVRYDFIYQSNRFTFCQLNVSRYYGATISTEAYSIWTDHLRIFNRSPIHQPFLRSLHPYSGPESKHAEHMQVYNQDRVQAPCRICCPCVMHGARVYGNTHRIWVLLGSTASETR